MVSAHPESEMRSGVNRAAILTSSVGHNMLLSPALDVRYPRFLPQKCNRLKTQHAYWEFNKPFRLPEKRRSDDATSLYCEFLKLRTKSSAI